MRKATEIVLLAFVECHFQRAERQGDKAETNVIEFKTSTPSRLHLLLYCRGVLDEPMGEKERQDGNRDIDEEYPAPVIIVGDPAS
jgi:hypothetical protein